MRPVTYVTLPEHTDIPDTTPVKYKAVADWLRERIQSGEWKPGTVLPTADVIASSFRVTYGTAKSAMKALRDTGWAQHYPGYPLIATTPEPEDSR